MEELFFELKQKVYEKLDINLDVSDEDLYKVIDVCIYEISQHTGMYITIQTVLLSMFLIIIAGGTLIAGGRMKLRTSMPYIPFLLVSLVCCVIGGGTILRTLLQ